MKILVTGASGLLGTLAVRAAASRHDVLGVSRREFDVTDPDAVRRSLREFSPDAVLHCAAYTDVDGAERAPERAFAVNATATALVAENAREVGAVLVHVSTDYVFDGEARSPYHEGSETSPTSVYGRSKLEGERLSFLAHPEGTIVARTGWLYGRGKGFVDWCRRRLERNEELPLVSDQKGSPTYAGDLAEALVILVEGGHRGLFHYVNAGEASWLELGRAVAAELGMDEAGIRGVRMRELERPAPRPRYSALSVARFEETTGVRVPAWRDALRRYLNGVPGGWAV